MKPNNSVYPLHIFAALALIALTGCGKKEPVSQTSEKSSSAKAAATPGTSFEAVTAQLDRGGDLYVYVGTEQFLQGLSGKVAGWSQLVEAIPDIKAEDRQHISQVINTATNLIRTSGLEELGGLGLSSIPREDGLHHSKALLYHAQGSSSGFLWNVFGREPHELAGLNLLPANTALAVFSDFDLPIVWSALRNQVAQSGLPQADELLRQMPEAFEKATGLNWEKVLGSLGGDYGFAIMLDDVKTVNIPLPQDQQLEIPEPTLMFVAKVKDDTIFNRIDEALKNSGQSSFASSRAGLRMRTLPVPLPLPIQLGFTVAQTGEYLFITTSDLIVQQALMVKAGEKPGLKSTDEFKRLAKDVPQQGNHFTFVSERLGKTINRIQRRALEVAGSKGASRQQQWFESLLSGSQPVTSYSVGTHIPQGWLFVANGNHSPARFLLGSAVVPAGIMAAVAVPNFVKAREAAQKQACTANLRRIETAKQKWAEGNQRKTESPEQGDLLPFLANSPFPVCPAGGKYTVNEPSRVAQCSIPGHTLDN
jgi:hypothetical protein